MTTIDELTENDFIVYAGMVPFVGLTGRAFAAQVREIAMRMAVLSPKQRERWLSKQLDLMDPGSPYHLTLEQQERVAKIIARHEHTPVGKYLAESEVIESMELRWLFHRYARPQLREDI